MPGTEKEASSVYHARHRKGSQQRVIPGSDPESIRIWKRELASKPGYRIKSGMTRLFINKRNKGVIPGEEQEAKSVSCRAQKRKPAVCHPGRRTGSQQSVIPGKIRNQEVCVIPGTDPESIRIWKREIASKSGYRIKSGMTRLFINKRNKGVIPGEEQEASSLSCRAKSGIKKCVSFRAQTRNPFVFGRGNLRRSLDSGSSPE